MTLKIINKNDNELKNYVKNQIREYNLKHFPDDLKGKYQEIHFFLQD